MILIKNAAYLNFEETKEYDMALAEGIFDYYGQIDGVLSQEGGWYTLAAIPPNSDFFDNIFDNFDVWSSDDIEYFLEDQIPEDASGHEGIEVWKKYREALEKYTDEDGDIDYDSVLDYISEAIRECYNGYHFFRRNNRLWILNVK